MKIEAQIKEQIAKAVATLFDTEIDASSVTINENKTDFEGDLTVVVFPYVRFAKKSPEQTGEVLGEYLQNAIENIVGYNVVKGFLNLVISESYWLSFLQQEKENADYGKGDNGDKIVLEYCGPNTNKPLHLGHIRNMLVGYATANLLDMAGNKVHKVNIYNDRGIAICKSMLAWQKYGEGKTPESEGVKGDHFVGKYYVLFDEVYKKEVAELVANGMEQKVAEKQAPLMLENQEMLLKWEAGDKETISLWEKMNNWVYDGFEKTFDKLGVDFEKHYKESEYYERGKELVEEGLSQGKFVQREDKSIWVNLEDDGLDEKLLLRADGTSVYITQDMGIAEARHQDYDFDQSIYVVGSEQNYHFKVLQLALQKLGKKYADGIYHLSYGMVDLPEGRMKSREGTVVDADDLIADMLRVAEEHTTELGKVDDFTDAEKTDLYRKLGLGAMKYFILKVNPKKRMIFNPKESIDFQGDTGPFVQYTYTRIQSLLRSQTLSDVTVSFIAVSEKALLKMLYKFPTMIQTAAADYDVSAVASYCFDLAKTFNKFYAAEMILGAETAELKNYRLHLSRFTAEVLKKGMAILGIEMPDRM
ncbi:MAG: arginine--tRNA ligase [Chitinophagales bacterium]